MICLRGKETDFIVNYPDNIAEDMIKMTGFRDIVIHEYQEMDMNILRAIAENEYKSLIEFCRELGVNLVISNGKRS